MGIVLDVAAAMLALAVSGSLVLIAWTLGVTAVQRVRRGRRAVAATRAGLARRERGLSESMSAARRQLSELASRTAR